MVLLENRCRICDELDLMHSVVRQMSNKRLAPLF